MRTCTPQKVGWGVVFGKTPAFRQHQDSITINNGVNAVGNSQNSAVIKNAAHGSLNQLVCVSIHSGRCLVHHNDTRPSTKSTGDFNKVCGPIVGTSNSTNYFAIGSNCLIRLAVANHADCPFQISKPEFRCKVTGGPHEDSLFF